MKSTLVNMVAVLFGITLVASAGVGAVHMVTAEPIAQAEAAAKVAALERVLPAFERTESETVTRDEMPITVYTATQGADVVGYAVETMSKNGFGGPISLMVGFSPAGEVLNVNVLKQTERSCLGTKMADEGNPLLASFEGRNPADMKLAVRKDGGDVDALTAATISSRAYVDAMSRAYAALVEVRDGETVRDGVSGASQQSANEPEAQEGGQNE